MTGMGASPLKIVAHQPEIWDLIDETAELELLTDGLRFGEGPIWNPLEQCLYFSSIGQDRRLRWTDDSGAVEVNNPNNRGNGMTYDADLNLLICEHSTSVLAREREGVREIVAAKFEGAELNSPNDVIVSKDGTIWFTDPFYGRVDHVFGESRPRELDFCGVFRARPGGELELVDRELNEPNGLCLAPGESVFYVNDSLTGEVWAHDLDEAGTLSNRRVFASGMRGARIKDGIVDGMKCDRHGNVWVTGPGGIWVHSPAGELLGVIEFPETVGNMHWGGPRWDQLYVCTWRSLFRVQTRVEGSVEPFMRVTP